MMKPIRAIAICLIGIACTLSGAAQTTTPATTQETITIPAQTLPAQTVTVLVPAGQQGPQGIQGLPGTPGTNAICPTVVIQPQTIVDAGDTVAAASGTFDSVAPIDPTAWYVGKVLDVWASGTEILAGEGANQISVALGTITLMPPQGQYPNVGPFNTTLVRTWNLHLKLVVVTVTTTTASLEVSGAMMQYGSQTGYTGVPVGTAISDIAPIVVPLTAANLGLHVTKSGYVAGDSTTQRMLIVQ